MRLHGKSYNHIWTKLSETSERGSSVLHLKQYVDWEIGMEVVVTPTGYNFREVEEHVIADIRDGGRTLILEQSLEYTHLSESETLSTGQTYSTTAEVGLLTRNIKIQGSPSSNFYGGRLLIGVQIVLDDDGFYTQNEGLSNKILMLTLFSCIIYKRRELRNIILYA